jgi:dTDP-4-amino-4,6-dideoxygalactose transaminase
MIANAPDVRSVVKPGLRPWPQFEPDEVEAARRVLESGRVNYWTGHEGRLFEEEFAAACECECAVAVANGSVALELALRALNLDAGGEVVVTPRTFIASASAAVLCGLRPVFADVDPESGDITARSIRSVLTPNTRAIIAVHLAGWPCEMREIMALADAYGLKVIEDCAQAHGAVYRGRPVGAIGHIAAWSFCQDKIITTAGEGGMITTNDRSLWERAWSYKDHGKSYEAVYNRNHPTGYRWVHESLGTNWRLTEVQCAIGRIQLGKLAGWVATRRRNAAVFAEALRDCRALHIPVPPQHVEHAYYKLYAYLRPEYLRSTWDREAIIDEINSRGVPCLAGICGEIYREKAFKDLGLCPSVPLPVAERLGRTSLMFLVHPTLTPRDMSDMAGVVRDVMDRASL